jgi:hypothetical protein
MVSLSGLFCLDTLVGQGRQALKGDPTPVVHDHCVEQEMCELWSFCPIFL